MQCMYKADPPDSCSSACIHAGLGGSTKGAQVEFLEALSMMVACKWLPCSCCCPASAKLLCGHELEPTNIATHECNARHPICHHHLHEAHVKGISIHNDTSSALCKTIDKHTLSSALSGSHRWTPFQIIPCASCVPSPVCCMSTRTNKCGPAKQAYRSSEDV